jgi:hypothetical protein
MFKTAVILNHIVISRFLKQVQAVHCQINNTTHGKAVKQKVPLVVYTGAQCLVMPHQRTYTLPVYSVLLMLQNFKPLDGIT